MVQVSAFKAIQFRQADLSDARDIAAIHANNFYRGWSEAEVRALLSGNADIGFVACAGTRVASFLLARAVAPEAEIISIAVDLAFRRRGLAKHLLAALEDELLLRRCDTIFLEVDETNRDALALYYTQGFKKAGIRSAYYESPAGRCTNALVLRKCLRQNDNCTAV